MKKLNGMDFNLEFTDDDELDWDLLFSGLKTITIKTEGLYPPDNEIYEIEIKSIKKIQ